MYRREYGSEFSIGKEFLENNENVVENNIINYLDKFNAIYYDSGRSALFALLFNLKKQKVLLPDYICESVRMCFSNSEIVYYHIDKKFQIDWNDLLEKCKNEKIDIVYIYYFNGYIDKNYDFDKLEELKLKNKFIIIEDTTHSIFSSSHTIGDFCICSLRKWFPIPDGGVLYSYKALNMKKYSTNNWFKNKLQAMIDKNYYLQGKDISKEGFLNEFFKIENMLDIQKKIYSISDISMNILKKIDIDLVINKRIENYEELNKCILHKKLLIRNNEQVPLFFIMNINNRDLLRKYLIDNKIYCPIHWPLYEELKNNKESILKNKKELSIPIDQRYSIKDMKHIAKIINQYNNSNE